MAFAGAQALGLLSLTSGDSDRCRRLLSKGEAILRLNSVSHNYLLFYPAAMETCLRLRAWDEVERYARALEDYSGAEPLRLTNFYVARARTRAAFGRGHRDDSTVQDLQRLRLEAERVPLPFAVPALQTALSAV